MSWRFRNIERSGQNAATKSIKIKPFPWKCQNCGKTAVRPATVCYPVEVEYDGRRYKIMGKGLKAPQCQKCRQIFPDAKANRQITQDFLHQAKLLTPQQIRRIREAPGLTHKQRAIML